MPLVNVHGRKVEVRDAGVEVLTGATKVVPVTPDNTDFLTDGVPRGLWVGTAGTLAFTEADGETERTGFPAQVGHNPICPKRIKATGTTASDIWALY